MEFKYKLDFYYQQALIYLITLILYAGIRGSFIENNFTLVFKDPLLYIIIFFVLQSFITLLFNKIRDRKLILSSEKITLHHKFGEKEILLKEIEWLHIGREKVVQPGGRFQVIFIKVKNRRRAYRIRVGRYEREKELLSYIQTIAVKIPKKQKKFLRNK